MKKILFVDILTTGTDCMRSAIYKLAAIYCEQEDSGEVKEIERFNISIRPHERAMIADTALWTGGTTRTEMLSFKPEREALEDFMAFLDRHTNRLDRNDKIYLAGYNSSAFELPFIDALFNRCGYRKMRHYFHLQTLDLMCIAAFCLMDRRKEMKDFHLSSVAQILGAKTTPSEKYSCMSECETDIEVYKALYTMLKEHRLQEQKQPAESEIR